MSNKDSNRLDEILESPWVLWAISVALACSLWIYIHRSGGASFFTQSFSAPLEYRTSDSQVRFLNRVPSVDVEVRGLEWRFAHFDPSSVIFYVDTRSVPVGTGVSSQREVRCEGLPEGITLVSRTPSTVNVRPVRENSNRIPVKFVLPDDIPQGYYVSKVEVNPREVLVRGTDRDLEKVTALQVCPTLAELQSGKEVTLRVQIVQSTAFEEGGVTLEPETVSLSGVLARGLPKKNVPVNVRRVGKPDEDYEIIESIIEPVEVQIEGNEDLLAKVTEIDTETVDISGAKTDFQAAVLLKAPTVEGVSLTDVKSIQVSFRMGEAKARKELTNIPVLVRNSEIKSVAWITDPPSVAITIENVPSKIRTATAENTGLQAFVNLSNVFLDSLSMPVSADIVSKDFKIIKVEPSIVTVLMDRTQRTRRTVDIVSPEDALAYENMVWEEEDVE